MLSFYIKLALPAISSTNLKPSHIIFKQSTLYSPIVISASNPDYKQSYNIKVLPCLCSRSKEILLSRHMWKNVLYCILLTPGWCKYLTYMKLRFCIYSSVPVEYWLREVDFYTRVPLEFDDFYNKEDWCLLGLSSSINEPILDEFWLLASTSSGELLIAYFPVY
jgi:hypothetical protein